MYMNIHMHVTHTCIYTTIHVCVCVYNAEQSEELSKKSRPMHGNEI